MKLSSVMILLSVLVIGYATAQVKPEPPEYQDSVSHQNEVGQCYEKMVKQLYAATDPNDPLQEGYLKSAEAYEKLAEANQSCA